MVNDEEDCEHYKEEVIKKCFILKNDINARPNTSQYWKQWFHNVSILSKNEMYYKQVFKSIFNRKVMPYKSMEHRNLNNQELFNRNLTVHKYVKDMIHDFQEYLIGY